MSERMLLLLESLAGYQRETRDDAPADPGDLVIRSYRPGDRECWCELVATLRGVSAETISFDRELRSQVSFRPESVVLVENNGRCQATVTVGREPEILPRAARLSHFGAEGPNAAELLRFACEAALALAHSRGFESAWSSADEPEVRPLLQEMGFVERKTQVTSHLTDHTDYAARVSMLRREHPDRPVGESSGLTYDARADESIYKPSSLGSARISPDTVVAGDKAPFSLVYRAGEYPLGAGASITYWTGGQSSLGSVPQCQEPEFAGYVECTSRTEATVEPFCSKPRVFSLKSGEAPPGGLSAGDLIAGPVAFGFRVVSGVLRNGDEVRLDVGRHSGFVWKALSDRKELKVIVDPGYGEPRMRLPEPLRIRITPRGPVSLQVLLPGSARPGDAVEATVTLRDEYDNRVSYNGIAILERYPGAGATEKTGGGPGRPSGNKGIEVYLNEGIGRVGVGVMGDQPLRLRGRCDSLGLEGSSNPCVVADDFSLFFGDMHTHDFLSTAEGFPEDCYRWGRDEKRLDFQALPVQVHRWIDNEKWAVAKHVNEYYLDEGRFVTFLSFEWQHSDYGDKVIHYLGGDMPYLPVDDPRYAHPAGLYEALRGTDAFIISHHPGYALDLHVPGTRWEAVETDIDRLVEIWSMHGSSEGFDPQDRPLIPPRRTGVYDALRNGLRMGFVGGSDTHTARPAGSDHDVRPYHGGYCGVWAERLTRRSLFSAFRARRTYALTGARIALRFEVNGAPMGSELPDAPIRQLSVKADAPAPVARVQFLKNAGVVREFVPEGQTLEVSFEYEDPNDLRPGDFYHCRVELNSGDLAVCSPVWVGVSP